MTGANLLMGCISMFKPGSVSSRNHLILSLAYLTCGICLGMMVNYISMAMKKLQHWFSFLHQFCQMRSSRTFLGNGRCLKQHWRSTGGCQQTPLLQINLCRKVLEQRIARIFMYWWEFFSPYHPQLPVVNEDSLSWIRSRTASVHAWVVKLCHH